MAVNALRAALKAPLLAGAKELTTEIKSRLKTPMSIQTKHRIAEMFDEFIMPELKKQGIVVELVSVDVDAKKVEMTASSSAGYAAKFAKTLLRKYIDQTIEVN